MLPPDIEAPDVAPLELPPQDEDEEDEEDGEYEEDAEAPKPSPGASLAGVARESTNTSPRMCSAYWAGTPGGLTGWVNTTCTPVAVTVISLELGIPPPRPN